MRERSSVGLGLALLSAITFATSGTFARPLITGEWSAVAVVIARVGIAALVLAVPAVLALRGRWTVLRRNAGSVVLFGLLGVATAQACFFNAVRYLPVGVALLLEYLGIVLVVGWMWLVHGQRPRLLTVAGSVTALCGLGLVLDLTGAGRLDPVGVLWGLGAGVGLAGYFVIAGRIDAGLPSVVMASGGMAVGAVALLLLGGLGALPLAAGTADVTFGGHRVSWLVPIAGLSLIAAVVAYLAGVAGTRLLGARLSSFVGLTEVMFAVLIAWLVLDELPNLIQLAGGALILGGVALVRADELRGTPSTSATAPAEPVLTGER
ncbi:EamA family transporter [Micromonospora aurantiaca]|uniref:EamA family transporter n=1 Tax=Micromonospora aurantiaca (nom. illeg.) TaxID=47850 RepID=A0A6N3KBW6_9ACTN|nr:EamA family transporter [Micromonospora aurantiaca]AXH94373.1 EamA/RhaT family transporter [Micromonospora aurantiaca]KAB1118172.1 EamA family transporter [Micromonospora aurantiaca]UFN94280.1 DMT family transporter [Micromonospora aurantiaca]